MNCTSRDMGLSSPHQTYLGEIRETALLSAAEEKELAEAIDRGDTDAKNRLIRANLRLVVKIAREYCGRGLMLDDLIGEGNLGLIRAAEEYDPRFGTRFSTYASYWIKQAIRHALINTTSTIRLPAHMIGLMTKWRRIERTLSRQLGFTPSAEEIASRLGLSETQKSLIAKAKRASQLKLESAFSDEGNHWSSSKSIDSYDPPESSIEAEEDRRELSGKLERLDNRERAILNYRFGLDGQLPLTLKEVGKRLGVTREWVRKIEIRALNKLSDDGEQPKRASSRERRSKTTRKVGSEPIASTRATVTVSQQSVASVKPARLRGRAPLANATQKVHDIRRTAIAISS